MVLDAGRGGWCPLIGAYTAALAAKIHALLVAFGGPTSRHQQTNKPTNKESKNNYIK